MAILNPKTQIPYEHVYFDERLLKISSKCNNHNPSNENCSYVRIITVIFYSLSAIMFLSLYVGVGGYSIFPYVLGGSFVK